MNSKKKLLICGYPRSGTTMLYYMLLERVSEKTLYEPCNIQVIRWYRQYHRYRDIDEHVKTRTHPYFSNKIVKIIEPYVKNFKFEDLFKHYLVYYPGGDFVKDTRKLKDFMLFFKDFNIKDVSLQFYLDNMYIQDNWEIYYIIRHPVDVYISHIKSAQSIDKILNKLYAIIGKISITKRIITKLFEYKNPLISHIATLRSPYTLEERFVLTWTVTNYYSLNILPSDKIIVYDNYRTYKKLPFKISKSDIKVKRYPDARKKYEGIFKKAAKEIGIDDMYEYVLGWFQQ